MFRYEHLSRKIDGNEHILGQTGYFEQTGHCMASGTPGLNRKTPVRASLGAPHGATWKIKEIEKCE
jgi:hypothetical protein